MAPVLRTTTTTTMTNERERQSHRPEGVSDDAGDGEAFAEGFRRLGLGRVVGARTWGGEIWLCQVHA